MNAESHIEDAEQELFNSQGNLDPAEAQLCAQQAIAHALIALAQIAWNARYGTTGFGLGGR